MEPLEVVVDPFTSEAVKEPASAAKQSTRADDTTLDLATLLELGRKSQRPPSQRHGVPEGRGNARPGTLEGGASSCGRCRQFPRVMARHRRPRQENAPVFQPIR